jgi:hypothetical protein
MDLLWYSSSTDEGVARPVNVAHFYIGSLTNDWQLCEYVLYSTTALFRVVLSLDKTCLREFGRWRGRVQCSAFRTKTALEIPTMVNIEILNG